MSVPLVSFPRPDERYSYQNESQFRSAVESAIASLDAAIAEGLEAIGSDVDFTGAVSFGSYIDLAIISAPASPGAGVARLWAADEQGHSVLHYTDNSGIDIELGRDSFLVVRNQTGVTITKGSAVYINGANGQVPTVALADATTDATMPAVGIAAEDILSPGFGMVISSGDLSMNTTSWVNGDSLYVSATTPGALTTTAPSGHPQRIGTVINGGSANGSVKVRAGGYVNGSLDYTWDGDHTFNGLVTLPLSAVTEAMVTQHEASLTITESQISDGSILARLAANETITGSWDFSNAVTDFLTTGTSTYVRISSGDGITPGISGILFRDNSVNRWNLYKTTANTFVIARYNSSGVFVASSLTIQEDGVIITEGDTKVGSGGYLYLNDTVKYPTDSLLYVNSSRQVVGTGVSATGDLVYNIDGSAWTHLAIGTTGQILRVSGAGLPEWSSSVGDADTLDGQHGTYYLARANHTGTQAVTTLTAGPDDTVLVTRASTVQWGTLTAADIGAGTFQTGNFKWESGDYDVDIDGRSVDFINASATQYTGQYFEASITQNGGTTNVNTIRFAFEKSNAGAAGGMSHYLRIYAVNSDWMNVWVLNPATTTLAIFSNVSGTTFTAANWTLDVDGTVDIAQNLFLRDSTDIPGDSLLYVDSATRQVFGTGAATTGDLVYNIDGTAWTSLGIGTTGQVLTVSAGGLPEWATATAGDAATLNGQAGSYYLSRTNHTGTQAVTTLTAGPDDTFLVVRSGTVTWNALDAADISPGTFLTGGSFIFPEPIGLHMGTNISTYTLRTVPRVFTVNQAAGVTAPDHTPAAYYYILSVGYKSAGWELAASYGGGNDAFFIRRGSDNAGSENGANVWQNWKRLATEGMTTAFTFGGTLTVDSTTTLKGTTILNNVTPDLRWYESDAGSNEKYTRVYQNGGTFSIQSMTDAAAAGNSLLLASRLGTGTTWDYMTWYVHDVRINAANDDNQYYRWYSNSTTGTTYLEFRRSSDSALKFRFVADSAGDFHLQNYNFSTLQDTWIFGDASTGALKFDGLYVELAAQIRATSIYDNGTIGSGATLNVDWNNGNSQRCAASAGNITIAMEQTSAYEGTSYTMQVTNIGASARTVTWSGIDSWVGSTSPTASITAGNMTVVQMYVARDAAGGKYIIGSVILDNTTVPA